VYIKETGYQCLRDVLSACEEFPEYIGCNISDANSKSILENSPIHLFSFLGHADAVVILLENGAIIDAAGDIGNTALHCAALGDHRDVIVILMARGANSSIRNEFNETPLDVAKQGRKKSAVSELRQLK